MSCCGVALIIINNIFLDSKIPCLRWDLEKIEKFSRKLTFFNSEKGAGIDQKDEEHFCWFIKVC